MIPPQIILLGFKNAGKSTIGTALAKAMQRTFVDLDEEIILEHSRRSGEKISCREIMKKHGDDFFRKLEHDVLHDVLLTKGLIVLALGGGTPMHEANRELLQKHTIIHITAPKSIVFERIMINGKPAFFPKDEEPFTTFQKLWNEREPVFQKLAGMTVENTGSVGEAVEKIIKKLG